MSSQVKSNPETIVVSFPCVHGAARGDLVRITCFRSEELKGSIKVVSAIDEEIAKRIIGATRHGESSSTAAHGVIALFSNPMFGGESYGLALAIGDKMARLGSATNLTQIIATGRIPYDGCGKIKPIEGFVEKLTTVAASVTTGEAIFIFPRRNLEEADDQIRQEIDKLEKMGIEWHAIDEIGDLDGLLWSTGQSAGNNSPAKIGPVLQARLSGIRKSFLAHRVIIVSILFGLATSLIFLFYYQQRSEVQRKVDVLAVSDPQQKEEMGPLRSNIEKNEDNHDSMALGRFVSTDTETGKSKNADEMNNIPIENATPVKHSGKSSLKNNVIESIIIDGNRY